MSIAKWTNRQTNRLTDKLTNRTLRCDIAEFGKNFELFFMSYTDDWEVNNPDQIKRLLLRFHKIDSKFMFLTFKRCHNDYSQAKHFGLDVVSSLYKHFVTSAGIGQPLDFNFLRSTKIAIFYFFLKSSLIRG